jgi:quinoprotein glucose dehydrogenase
MPRRVASVAALFSLVWLTSMPAPRAMQQRAIDWPAYAGDAAGTKYSPAAQITRQNVKTLVPVWTYRTGDYSAAPVARDETTPILVDGVLYASTPFGGVRALDETRGRERWAFDAELDLGGDYGDFTNRGVSTWLDERRPAAAPCRRRIFVAPVDARLIALDARTGAPCADFGQRGQVYLDRGLLHAPAYQSEYSTTSPPAVVNGLVIVGSSISDNKRAAAPNGVVRAFDARTGAQKWAWDPLGSDASKVGAANAWSIITVDAARDLVFVPVGSASPDFFGGERPGENLYANSLVALRASTGRRVWHFQVVHHDLWDYDVPAQPVLFTLHRGGQDIPAVAQATKMGHLFILNRLTGEPLFPVEERAVPASDVPGEQAWPTQPFPLRPPPLVPGHFTPDEAFGVTAESRAWCRERAAALRSEGIFTPPSLRGSILYPGNIGGSNWSGVAIDIVRNLAFLPLNRIATVVELIPRDTYREEATRTGRDFEVAPQSGTAFGMRRQTPLAAPDGVPCTPPPFGTLASVDLQTGDVKWNVPFGRVKAFAALAGSDTWGSPNLGGAMATGGGLVFAGGAMDDRLHAFDADTGAELWSWELPAGVHAAPMTYVTGAGRQLVVVAAGGHKELHSKPGDYLVAFGLPQPGAPTPAAEGTVAAGRYEGHIVLDRTRLPMTLDLRPTQQGVAATLVTRILRVEGTGTARIAGDRVEMDIDWRYAEKGCSGTIHLAGAAANDGSAIVGDLTYKDGCDRDREKGGTFAGWRGPRTTTSLPR